MKLTNADYIDWLADAEGNVRTAKAVYDRAVEQYESVKRRWSERLQAEAAPEAPRSKLTYPRQ